MYDFLLKNLVRDLSKCYEIKYPIEDIEKVVRKMGGRIVHQSTPLYSTGIKKVDDSFEIYVSPFLYDNRTNQRTRLIAHELGNLFLHMGYLTNKKLWDCQKNDKFYNPRGVKDIQLSNEFAELFLRGVD